MPVDFIGLGVPKAGTSWLYYCLKEHPQICVSEPKELDFFNKNHGFHQPAKPWNFQKGISWYLNHFDHCPKDKIKGEFSTRYFFEKDASLLIKQFFPQIKVIICLRNPAERAYSHYWHIKSKTETKELFQSFEEALAKEPEFKNLGLYGQHLKNCFEIFPKENILVLIYEDIVKNPLLFVQGVYQFLRVNAAFSPKFAKRKANVSSMRLSGINKLRRKTYELLSRSAVGMTLIKTIKVLGLNRKSVEFLVNKLQKMPEMNKKTRQDLREFYEEDIAETAKLLSRDLSFWQ